MTGSRGAGSLRQSNMEHRQGGRRRVLVLARVQQRDGQSEGGIVYDISRDGMFVVSVLKPGLYNHVNVVATGADGTSILFPGIVIHHNESGFGLLFQQLDGSARSFLQKCLC